MAAKKKAAKRAVPVREYDVTKHPFWPKGQKHPGTGEKLVRGSITTEVDILTIETMPPTAPTRAIYDYDEVTDEEVYVRDRTDEEMEKAQAEYESACSTHTDIQRLPGMARTSGTFFTKKGAEVSGIHDGHDGGKWIWTRWAWPDA